MKKNVNDWVEIANKIILVMGIDINKADEAFLYQLWAMLDFNLEDSSIVSYEDFKTALDFYREA
jgi:hypothetical protein